MAMSQALSEEEFHRMQAQLLELRTQNYQLSDDLRKNSAELNAVRQKNVALERDFVKAQKALNKSKKAQEVDALLSENEMLQGKLHSQEEDFRLQNSTLMTELSKLCTQIEQLEQENKGLKEGGATSASNPPANPASSPVDGELLRLQAENSTLQKEMKALQERYDRELQRQTVAQDDQSATTETDGSASANGVSDVAGRGEEPAAEGANDRPEQTEAQPEPTGKQLHELEMALNTEQEEKRLLREQIHNLEASKQAEITKLQEEITKLSDKLKKKQESFQRLQGEKEVLYNDSRTKIDEINQKKEEELKALNIRIQKLQSDLMAANQVTAELREQLQSKEKEHELAVHTLKDQVANQSAISQEQVDNILQENDALRTNLAALEQIQTVKTQEMNLLREQQEALTAELQQRRAEQESLLAQRDDLDSQLQESSFANRKLLEQLTEEGQEKEKLLRELDEAKKTAEKRKAMLDDMAIQLNQEKSDHKEALSDLRLQHEKEVLGVRARYEKELRGLHEDKNRSEEEIRQQLRDEKARTKELEGLQQRVEELQAQVLSMEGTKGWFERRLKEAEENIEKKTLEHQEEIERLQKEHTRQLEEKQAEMEGVKQQLAEVEKQRDEHNDAIGKLKQEIKDTVDGQRILEKKGSAALKDLKRQLQLERKRADKLQERLQEILTNSKTRTGLEELVLSEINSPSRTQQTGDSSSVSSFSYRDMMKEAQPTNQNKSGGGSPQSQRPAELSDDEVGELFQRLAEVQQEKWMLEEKVKHLEVSCSSMAEDICRKSAIIETYVMDSRIGAAGRISLAIALDNQLVVLATTAADAGRYHVEAINEMTGENVTSPAIYLSISVGKKNRGSADPESELVAPAIVIGPKDTTVAAGSEATLECIANARPVENLVVSWKRDGRRLASGRRLIIHAPTSSDTGLYVCEASLSNSTAKPVEARAHLTVMEPPSLTAQPRRKLFADLDRNVDIPCLATGVPQPRIEWFKDAVPLSKLANPRYKVNAATGLTVRRVQPGDGGIFQCLARNAAGETQTHTQLLVSSVAPTFTFPPSDQTVTDGNTALFTCQTSGAPKPAITWRKGSQVLASGSVQVPRFTLLQSGGLEIQPISFQDSGEYTCIAFNSEGTINATATLTVWSRTLISVPPTDQRVIKGTTAILDCNATHDPRVNISFKWDRGGMPVLSTSGGRVSVRQGSLTIGQTWSGDIGDYTCTVTSQAGNDSRSARLEVIELPHSPRSLTARLNDSDSRSVLLSWLRPFDGNSPLLYYLLELSENNSPWKVYLSEVDPAVTAVSVGGLTPARTYQFRLCAVNQVGRGQYSTETQRLMLREEAPSAPPKNIVASGRTNQSIMVQWQPPPEPQLNGVLRGYVLRYRLAGLPGDYQEKNISSPETNYCLLKDLIIWTQYQIQVAAYTGAGLGVYSSPVTEYTLQGVPTAPPQEVEVLAINSTTIRFTWNPPPQQFINGINQGYKLLVWPEKSPEDVTVVTITPDYPGARHTGLVSGLKKFTWYFGSTLCFTTPGDGPRSPPTLLQTHEDTPGAVRHLSFTEILDTSLRVSWAEPEDKNGIITGYMLWWEVPGVESRREERSLSNSTLQYQLTGLTSTTVYTLQVAALTAAGRGVVTSSTISTGVPPELPGAPSNLVISNISPRTATLRFRPGHDGKTAISQWIVEGQVVKEDGKEEAWRVVYQKDNQPDADTLEIPDLSPFTQYRFRMRQVNIVGSSPMSAPSRVIQTLQAAPDTPPSNLTLLSATQTSLCLNWKPLPESEYNSSPETVGYRLRVWRTDGQGEDRTEDVEGAGGISEATVEGLNPWTQYQVQIQAYNSIGPGPWSNTVAVHTAESVPSGSPVNVTAEAVSSTSILLTWSALPLTQRNGVILGYKVLYSEKDSEGPPTVQVVRGEGSVSLHLGFLQKYTVYMLQVLAYTQMGDGPPCNPILLRTKEDVPGPPVRMVFPEVRLSSVRVVWQPPTNPNGIILGYQISYRLDSRDPQRWTTVEVGSNARQFTVTGLSHEQTYVFRLTARTAVGWGEEQEALVVTTERRERPQPPRKLSAPQDGVESRRLRLHWVMGGSGSSPLRYFTLQVKELPNGNWNTHTSDISYNVTTLTVDRLKPFTSYKFRMQATNDVGDSVLSKETEAVTTLQDVPDEPPVILAVKPTTTTSVLVHWKPPSDESINGMLTGYRLYYRELPVNTSTSTEAEVQATKNNTTSALITAKSTFKTVSSASLTEFELTQLKKFKRYQIVMTSYNIIGESPPSSPVEVSVGEAAPSVAPQSIRVSAVSPSTLEVSWDAPPLETQNGLIQGYKIHYWERDKQNQSEKVKVIFVPDTRVHLTNLTSYTPYLATLTAFNTAGDGPPSDPRGARTLQSAPSQPSYLSFSEVTEGSVNVSWGAPLTPNGQLEGYRVIYQPTAPVQGVSKVVTVDVRGSWQRWLKVRDLIKGAMYTFSVQALTVSYGPPIKANITAQPVQGSPGSPMEMSITKTSSALTIHWSEGETGAAPVTGYIIESRPSDEGVWDSFIRLLPPSSRSVSVPLERLRSGISYEFRVIAVNRYGYGQPSSPSAALAALTERPFYEEWWFLLVMALVGLILILVVVFTLLLHGHSTKYKTCGTGKHMSTAEESVTLDNGGFTALELNSRTLNTKNSFLKKNGTRSPPRPSPGGLHYSDEDICNNYNGAVLTESTTLTEKPTEVSESELTDSDYEDEQPKHSFVNHYMSDPTYYNSWKRQPKGLKGIGTSFGYEECATADAEPYYQTVVTQHSTGGVYTPTGQPAHTHVNPNTNPPGSRTPVTGFSSFV